MAADKKPRPTRTTKKISDARATYRIKDNSVQIIEAVYDGKVLLPSSPLPLKPNTRVRITVEEIRTKRAKTKSFIETARSAKLKGPRDFSENLDDYLYRGKKFNEG